MSGTGSFADLKTRISSAIVMAVVGIAAIWAGGIWLLALLAVVAGLMLWELIRMLDPTLTQSKSILLALVGGAAVFRVGFDTSAISVSSLLLAPVIGLVLLKKDRTLFAVYGMGILFAVAGLFWIRAGAGLNWTIWLVLVVIATDIGGYFFGRILGGPKILPVISPKKTWSGTLGGWALAICVGAGFMVFSGAGPIILGLSLVTAIASQAGDVAESAIKRHTGIKDSSNLIPGHGGFLDRFDALITAALLVLIIGTLLGLPASGMA